MSQSNSELLRELVGEEMTLPRESSNHRVLVEVQLRDAPGLIFAVELVRSGEAPEPQDGPADPLTAATYSSSRTVLDLRVSELLDRNERDELERLREIVRRAGNDATE